MKRDAIGLQVSLDVEGRHVVVLGGDAEAEDKVARLLDGGAQVTVIAREPAASLAALATAAQITLFQRDFARGDLNDADMVLVCARDEALAGEAERAAEARGVAVWACDDPERSHLAMPAVARLGRARLAVSTGGAAPALAAKMRASIERDLGPRFGEFVARLGAERERLLREEPDADKRRAALRALVGEFDLRLEARYPEWFAR
jgi:siroheme synthase-like protein